MDTTKKHKEAEARDDTEMKVTDGVFAGMTVGQARAKLAEQAKKKDGK